LAYVNNYEIIKIQDPGQGHLKKKTAAEVIQTNAINIETKQGQGRQKGPKLTH